MNRRALLWGGVTLAAAALLFWAGSGREWSAEGLPEANPDCFLCHDQMNEGPAGLHEAMPCEICHLGNPKETNVLAAHRGMVVQGAALEVVDQTCGRCHAREVAWVKDSPMATGRGLVAVDRWVFGEISGPAGQETFLDVAGVADPTPAQDHLRRLCMGCHLNTTRENRDDIVDAVTGSGCSACHIGSAEDRGHSALPGTPSDERCFGCHSRSSRISLTYRGLAEVSGPWLEDCTSDTLLVDGRTLCRIPADVHHDAGMACVDCHLHTELMGDSVAHFHAEHAVEISCETCHGPVPPEEETRWWQVADSVPLALLRLHGEWRDLNEPVRLGRYGTPMWNLRREWDSQGSPPDSLWVLYSKATGEPHPVTPTPSDLQHRMPGHEDLSCAACHAASAPTCPTCHTTFDRLGEQWDFGSGKMGVGAWVETTEGVGSQPPRLALGADARVLPAIPGMVGEIDARPAGGQLRRLHLFSVLDPHSTVNQGRSCGDCHLDAGPYIQGTGTRVGARPLSGERLRKVLAVGPCLECHEGDEDWWMDYLEVIERLDPRHPEELKRGKAG